MKKQIIHTLLITTFILVFGENAKAQSKDSAIGAPSGFNLNGDLNLNSKILLGVLRRVNKLGMESYFAEMQKDGIKSRSFAVNLEGALVYNYELGIGSGTQYYGQNRPRKINGIADMDDTGRDAGGRLFPFKMDLMIGGGGEKRVSFSAFSFKNMNDYQRAYGGAGDWAQTPGSISGWTYIDNLDLITFTWDQNYSFNNLRTFDFQVFRIEPMLPLAGGKRYSLALRGSMDAGGGNGNFVNDDGSRMFLSAKRDRSTEAVEFHGKDTVRPIADYQPNTTNITWRWNYSYGVQYKQKFNNGDILNVQSNWRAGIHQNWLYDSDIAANNQKLKTQFEADHVQYIADDAQYKVDRGQYDVAKVKYASDNGLLPENVTDAYFDSQQTQYKAPSVPVAPGEKAYPVTIVSADRKYGYLTTSFSYSKLLNAKKTESSYALEPGMQGSRPLRLGFEVEWNLYVRDGFMTPPRDVTYDFNKNNRRMMTGKIYLKF